MLKKATEVVTGEVRISYEHLLKPYAQRPNAEPKYSVTLLIPKSDKATKERIDAAIQAAISEGVSSKWSGARPLQPSTPIHDGDGLRPSGEAFGEECKDHWVMTASSKQPQDIVDVSGNPIINATEIYSGMYARVFIKFFAYNSNGRGIGAGLGPVQKTRDGEPLGGKISAADAFGDTAGQYQPQPTPNYQQTTYTPPQYQIDPITGQPVVLPY